MTNENNTDLIKQYESNIRQELGLNSKRPIKMDVVGFIYTDCLNSGFSSEYAYVMARGNVLRDKAVLKIAEEYGIVEALEREIENNTKKRLFIEVTSSNESLISKALNEILDREDAKSMISSIAYRLYEVPGDIIDRLKDMKDHDLDFAFMRGSHFSDKHEKYLIDSENPLYYAWLLKNECTLNAILGRDLIDRVTSNFDDSAVEVILPHIARYCKRASYDFESLISSVRRFYNRCQKITTFSSGSKRCLNSFGKMIEKEELAIEKEIETGQRI